MESIWNQLYGNGYEVLFEDLVSTIRSTKENIGGFSYKKRETWYSEAVVYALYVDLYAGDFTRLEALLPGLKDLGINCIWLLPILDSPMKDAGFDIKDYRKIRPELLGNSGDSKVFENFINTAHSMGINIIFDVAINHTSNEHPWFLESKKSKDNPYHNYYIWNDTPDKYSDCRLIFEGMCPSNWEKCGNQYYFHRFFEFQPDLNYKNPEVLCEMIKVLLFWIEKGVDGFRADAIPYLWKTEGTDCENLPETHLLVKFFRKVIDAVAPETLLLAEACQPPAEVVKYMGNGDECHAGYHFPLMPQIFKSIATADGNCIKNVLNKQVTPDIPEKCTWFTFLRLHDELSLEKVYVNEEDRRLLHEHYCRKPEWDFRIGQGISARLSDLMENNPDKILLAFSIILSLPGTPLIYYGDEYAKQNDVEYYHQQLKETGYNDTRYLVRGFLDIENINLRLKNKSSAESIVYTGLKNMLKTRNNSLCFRTKSIEWINSDKNTLAFFRRSDTSAVLAVHNLSDKKLSTSIDINQSKKQDLLGNKILTDHGKLVLEPYTFRWIES